VLRYAGLKAVDARGRVLPSRMELRAGEVRLVVEDRDARYPLTVDPTWTQQQELTASDGASQDVFGYSVSVSGNTALIGAPSRTINSNADQGAAYVFVRGGGVWTEQMELTAKDGAANDSFGISVSVSGNTAVIGADGKNSSRGAAYVFVSDGLGWTQQQELTASDGAPGDDFGISVSVSGNTAVIGAPFKTINSNADQGAAYVFAGSATESWTPNEQYRLTATDGVPGDDFGISVSVSGNTAVIGAYGKNSSQGAAYVFVFNGKAWAQQPELTANDGAGGDDFGASVSVSGNTAVIGAPGKTINSNANQGAAYVLARDAAGAWTWQQKLTASDGMARDSFGSSVSASGDTAVIGAFHRNYYSGAAYMFVNSAGVWTQQQELAAPGAGYGYFGSSVSVSGGTVVVGATNASVGMVRQGAAYIYLVPVLGTSSLLVGSAGGSSSVAVSFPSGGAWTATANDSFLQIAPGSESGVGSAVVVFTYDAFTGTGTRTGTLTVAGLPVTVTQAGTNFIGPTGSGPLITLVSSVTNPWGVAVDGSGNVYYSGYDFSTLKEWSAATHTVTELVSTGLLHPTAVAVDGSGNVYVADFGNNAVKEWNAATQTVTVLASTGAFGPDGVAVDGFGDVAFSVGAAGTIMEWIAATQWVTMLASQCQANPSEVAVDIAGNVYFSTTDSGAVCEWIAATGQVTTLVSSGLNFPVGVAVDGSGNVYVADQSDNAIYEWSAATQTMSSLVSSGLSGPQGVAVDGSGNVYLADNTNNAIKEIPYAFVAPASATGTSTPGAATEASGEGSDSLTVLPATASLTGPFKPTSNQSWLTIGTPGNGVVPFTFAANTGAARTATISILGQQITVTQDGSLTQTITFSQLPDQPYGGTPTLSASVFPSGLPISFAATAASSGVCSVTSSGSVMLLALGKCTIEATQAGNASYAAATPVAMSFNVIQGSQTIAFGPLASVVSYGAAPFTVTAISSSGQAVSFNTWPATASVCTVSGATVTLLSGGACTIQATVAASADYAAATNNASFTVAPASQTISFGALTSQVFGAVPFPLIASATSSLPVSFASTTPAVCTVSDSTVTLVTIGLCTIQATQAGNATYAAATPVNQPFEVNQGGQTITFAAVSDKALGTAPFTVSATASSGLAVSLASTTSPVCTVSGATVTLVSAGACAIRATQTGNANYAAATPVTRSFQVTGSSCGGTSVGDVQRIINEALGVMPASAGDDFNGDGVINAVDVQNEINAALGLGCGTG
jgi:streptogramin lyase